MCLFNVFCTLSYTVFVVIIYSYYILIWAYCIRTLSLELSLEWVLAKKAETRLDEAEAYELLGEVLIGFRVECCRRDGWEMFVARHPVDETVVKRVALRPGWFVQRHICIIKLFTNREGWTNFCNTIQSALHWI